MRQFQRLHSSYTLILTHLYLNPFSQSYYNILIFHMKLWKTTLPKNTQQFEKNKQPTSNYLTIKNNIAVERVKEADQHTQKPSKHKKFSFSSFEEFVDKFSETDYKNIRHHRSKQQPIRDMSPVRGLQLQRAFRQNQQNSNKELKRVEEKENGDDSVVQEVFDFGSVDVGEQLGKIEQMMKKQLQISQNSSKTKLKVLNNQIKQVLQIKQQVMAQITQFLKYFKDYLTEYSEEYSKINRVTQNTKTIMSESSLKHKYSLQIQQFYLKRIDQLENKIETLQSALEEQERIKQEKLFSEQCKLDKIQKMHQQEEVYQQKLSLLEQEIQKIKDQNMNLEEQLFLFQQKNVQIQLEIAKRIEDILTNHSENSMPQTEAHKKFYQLQIQHLQKQITLLKGKQNEEGRIGLQSSIKKEEFLNLRESHLNAKQKQLQEEYLQFEKLIRDTDERLKWINEKESEIQQEYARLELFRSEILEKETNIMSMQEQTRKKQRSTWRDSIEKIKNENRKLDLGNNLSFLESQNLMELREKELERKLSLEKAKRQKVAPYENKTYKLLTSRAREKNNKDFRHSLALKHKTSYEKPDDFQNISNQVSAARRTIIQKSKSSSIFVPHFSPSRKQQTLQNLPGNSKVFSKKSRDVERLNQLQNTLQRLRREIQEQINDAF